MRLHGTVARKIGILIVSGKYPPGHLLSGEISSSAHLSISRTAYREAVRILAAKGMLESRPKAGTRVTPRSSWHLLDPDVLEWTFDDEPDIELLDSLFELRNVVESAAAGLAAARRSPEDLRAMREALTTMATQTLATEQGRAADLAFHAALLSGTKNPYIVSLIDGVKAAVRATTLYKQRHQPLRRDPLPDHMKVYEAIAARESEEAERAMSELIKLARIDTPAAGRKTK